MDEEKTVTVAGVPVTIEATDGHLAVTVGRFEPSAAAGLHIHPRYGTSSVGLYVADADGDTAHKPDHRWFFDLHPAPPAAVTGTSGAPGGATLLAGRGNAGTGECGAPLTLGPQHDPYQTTCDQAESHFPGTDHAGPHPLGTRPGDRITWRGGGRCAGDPLPYEITSEAWQEDLR